MPLEAANQSINPSSAPIDTSHTRASSVEKPTYSKLTTSKLAQELGVKTQELKDKLVAAGYLEEKEGELVLTDAGVAAGGISKRGKFGNFCVWDVGMVI